MSAADNRAELVLRLAFLGRSDVVALRQQDGSYRPERRSLTSQDAADHIASRSSFGVYPLDGDTTRLCVLDFDDHASHLDFDKLATVAKGVNDDLIAAGLRTVVFRSGGGRGIHIWILFAKPQAARNVRAFARRVLGRCGLSEGTKDVEAGQVEIFPKQDRVDPGALGNLIALPLSRLSRSVLPSSMTGRGSSLSRHTQGCAVLMFPPRAAVARRPRLGKARQSFAPKLDSSGSKRGVRLSR